MGLDRRLVDVFVTEVGGVDKAVHAAAIKAFALELVGHDTATRCLGEQGVGQLDFAVSTRRGIAQYLEDIGRQDVTADDGGQSRKAWSS